MGASTTIPTTETPEIVVEQVNGDLSLRGWSRSEILLKSGDERTEWAQTETGVRLNVRDDAVLQVPMNASVRLRSVKGDVSVSAIGGALSFESVDGDLSVRDCGPLTIGSVKGDLAVRMVRGDCRIGSVSGDASLGNVLGSATVESVGDDLEIHDVRGSVSAAASDDLSMRLLLLPGCTYTARAGGDLTCRIQAEANAHVHVECGGRLTVRRLNAPVQSSAHTASFDLGEDAERSQLTLIAGDDLTLVGLSLEEMGDLTLEIGADMGMRAAELAQHIAAQIEASVSTVARQLDEKLSKLSTNDELAARIQEKIQGALRKAEESVAEALRNVEVRSREAERRAAEAEQRQRGRGFPGGGFPGAGWPPPAPPTPPRPPRPVRPAASEEERIMILKMVSENKISVEQAEKLLAALNGQQPPADR